MNGNNDTIIVYGATWCPDCRRAKQFFGEHRIQYRWVDIEQDSEAMTYVEEVNRGKRIIPTIVFPDGDILVEPSDAHLAEKLGLQTRGARSFYDAIIFDVSQAPRYNQVAARINSLRRRRNDASQGQ